MIMTSSFDMILLGIINPVHAVCEQIFIHICVILCAQMVTSLRNFTQKCQNELIITNCLFVHIFESHYHYIAV